MSDGAKLRDLPIDVESFEFEANDVEYSAEFTRGSTIIHLKGGGHEGVGRGRRLRGPRPHREPRPGPAVRPDRAEDPGRALRAARRARPVRGRAARARRLPPLPPLGVRVGGARPGAPAERDPAPRSRSAATRSRFASSARPGSASFGDDATSSTDADHDAPRALPGPGVQARPGERLGRGPDRRDRASSRASRCWTSRASTRARSSRSRPIRSSTGRSPRQFPEAWLEDPDLNDATREVLAPHSARLTYDAPLHSVADIVDARAGAGDQLEAVAMGLARGALRGLRALRARGPRDLLGRPGRGRPRARPGPVPGLALPPRHAERHRALRLQRPRRAGGDADEPDGPGRRPRPGSGGASPSAPRRRPPPGPSSTRRALLRPVNIDIRWEIEPPDRVRRRRRPTSGLPGCGRSSSRRPR